MSVAHAPGQPAPPPPFGAVVARQLSVWPFAARTQRLFLLVDPSLPDQALRKGLLKAMQQAYFRSDSCSQTRAVREAALAAHYVLQHRNREVLPQAGVSAAAAIGAVRGNQAYVALAGDAAAFAWRDGELKGQHGVIRLPRPLGLEQDPRITLWSTPLEPGKRLVLVCGAAWQTNSPQLIAEVMRSQTSGDTAGDTAEERLARALGATRPAGVLIVDPARPSRPDRNLVLVSSVNRGRDLAPPQAAVQQRGASEPEGAVPRSRWMSSLLALVLLSATALAALNPPAQPPRLSLVEQSGMLLAQASETVDPYQAHALAASALELAQQVSSTAPGEFADLRASAARKLDEIDRVATVDPTMAVRLGPSGGNVVDLAVGDDALYTLDVVERSVRAFALDAHNQQPTPNTLLTRAGAPIAGTSRPLAAPVAMRYVAGHQTDGGSLAIVDQTRSVVQVGRDRTVSPRPLASSGSWRELGALGADGDGHLYVLDSGSRRLLEYPLQGQRLVDAPRVLLDAAVAPELAFNKAAEVVGQAECVFLRMDDGSLHRLDSTSGDSVLVVRPPDGQLPRVAGIAPDRSGGLYLADPANARILQTTAAGALLRQLRAPALGGLRQIQSSLDGRRLYGLVAAGVLVFDLPEPTVT